MAEKSIQDKAKLLLNALEGKNTIESQKNILKIFHETAAVYQKALESNSIVTKDAAISGFMYMHGEMECMCNELLMVLDDALTILTQCGALFADISAKIDPNSDNE